MNKKSLVRLSNAIGIVSIILLVYWVFVFISITVFGLKIFRENLTETFYLSVVGIIALMIGALIINVMVNLTRIAEKHNQDDITDTKKTSKKIGIIFVLSFPIIIALLFGGDYLTSRKKKRVLISAAHSIINSNVDEANKLLNYSFNREWLTQTADILELYSKTDKNFPSVSLIVADTIGKTPVFLSFGGYYVSSTDTFLSKKLDFIAPTTEVERVYLNRVFYRKDSSIRFSTSDGNSELFYPYSKGNRKVVLYFAQYQRYGKIGS